MTPAELEGDTLGQEESDTEADVLAALLCDESSDEEVSAVALASNYSPPPLAALACLCTPGT